MSLERLDVRGVRNLEFQSLRDLAAVNVFYGVNGSGKTSVLEAVHLLGLARSFRTAHIKSLITYGETSCTVYGEVRRAGSVLSMGVQRERDGSLDARVSGTGIRTRAELAQVLPMQVIHTDSFKIISGGPTERRQFLDWGVFHVEHQFLAVWQQYQKAIKQRNSLLRRGKISPGLLRPWDEQMAVAGERIDVSRAAYMGRLVPTFQRCVDELAPRMGRLELRYRRGWDKDISLREALVQSEATDQQQGFTHVGPQRADIRMLIDGKPAAENLSRGQMKLVVCALKLAQGELIRAQGSVPCIYLVDDLTAELDIEHCRKVARMLERIEAQQFVTCIQRKDVETVWQADEQKDLAMFHVEHGTVNRLVA